MYPPDLKGTDMRLSHSFVLSMPLVLALSIAAQQSGQPQVGGQKKGGSKAAEAAGRYAAADVRVLTVGIIYNAGLVDLAASYEKETGKKVEMKTVIMGAAVNAIKTGNPPADVIMLPFELMSTLSLEGDLVPNTYLPLGRSEMGLAVKAGAPHPDISTVEQLAAALRSATTVMRSDPNHGSMVGQVIDQMLKRPEFVGVHSVISTQGMGGEALARGEGDMALQAICEILPYKQIELVGPLPRELGAWIDMATAVSARAMHRDDGISFLKYLLRPESRAVWHAKGLERFQ
jgi:molybdate transport system substrate-binding protein